MMLTKLLFVRHSSVEYTSIPDADLMISLSLTGRAQAFELGEILANSLKLPITAIYSSDLPRAAETIIPCAERINLPVSFDPRLREHNYNGDPKVFHQAIKTDPFFCYDGGENILESRTRFLAFISDILKKESKGCSIISTHGTVFTEFMKEYFGKTDDFYYELSNPDIYYVLFDGLKPIGYKRLLALLPQQTIMNQ